MNHKKQCPECGGSGQVQNGMDELENIEYGNCPVCGGDGSVYDDDNDFEKGEE